MLTIELDTVADGEYGDTGESAARKITEGYNVACEVVTENGPGGGNPIIRYAGPADEVKRMVAEHYRVDTVFEQLDAGDFEMTRTLSGN
jgi:hypothetical protein